ncbi:MAG TPA: hypothetical protein VLD40_04125, partial [Dissulfurispiraceae bacterium]|nr:hypothetical protein [Dissulfurispiraceae bacterium]
GAMGKAITFASEEDVHSLPDIEEYIKQKMPVIPLRDEMIAADLVKTARRRRGPARPADRVERRGGGERRRGGRPGEARPREGRKPRGR